MKVLFICPLTLIAVTAIFIIMSTLIQSPTNIPKYENLARYWESTHITIEYIDEPEYSCKDCGHTHYCLVPSTINTPLKPMRTKYDVQETLKGELKVQLDSDFYRPNLNTLIPFCLSELEKCED